jgi:hypothetical protein
VGASPARGSIIFLATVIAAMVALPAASIVEAAERGERVSPSAWAASAVYLKLVLVFAHAAWRGEASRRWALPAGLGLLVVGLVLCLALAWWAGDMTVGQAQAGASAASILLASAVILWLSWDVAQFSRHRRVAAEPPAVPDYGER